MYLLVICIYKNYGEGGCSSVTEIVNENVPQTGRGTDRQRDREAEGQTGRGTDRQRDRQTEGQTDKMNIPPLHYKQTD